MEIAVICLTKCKGVMIGLASGMVHEFVLIYNNSKKLRFRDFLISIFVSAFVGWGAWEALPEDTAWVMKTGWTVLLSLNSFPLIAMATSKEFRQRIVERFLPPKK